MLLRDLGTNGTKSADLGAVEIDNFPVRSGLSEVEFSPMKDVLHEEVPF